MDAIDYGAAPQAGETVEWAGTTYTVDNAHSLTLRDGTLYAEIFWRFDCVECGKGQKIRTGLRKRYLPKRCKACNGPKDMDKIERRAYAQKAWVERMKAARTKQGPAFVRADNAALIEDDCMAFDAVFSDRMAIPMLWVDGGPRFKATEQAEDDSLDDDGIPRIKAVERSAASLEALRLALIEEGDLFS